MSTIFALVAFLAFLASIFLFVISIILEKKGGDYKPVGKMTLSAFCTSFTAVCLVAFFDKKPFSDVMIFAFLYLMVSTVALFILSIFRKIIHGKAGSCVTWAFASLGAFFIVLVSAALVSPRSSSADTEKREAVVAEDTSKTEDISAKGEDITDEPAPASDSPKEDETADKTAEEAEEIPEAVADDSEAITIISGEPNEYSQELVLNEGTGDGGEYRFLGYFVPTGSYKATNTGQYREQITICKNEKHLVDGWEEWTDGIPVLLEPNETKDITVEEGYFVKIADGNGSVELRRAD